jgi:hypothetical protein
MQAINSHRKYFYMKPGKSRAFRIFIFIVLFLFAGIGYADELNGETKDIKKMESSARQTKDDFFGLLVVTGSDWHKEWNTPPNTVPRLTNIEKIYLGQEISVLTFFANPLPDTKNKVNVVCGIKVIRPNASISIDQPGIPCLRGSLKGPAANIRLSPGILKFTAERTDPVGTWQVEVFIEDKNRNTKLELKTSFVYLGEST